MQLSGGQAKQAILIVFIAVFVQIVGAGMGYYFFRSYVNRAFGIEPTPPGPCTSQADANAICCNDRMLPTLFLAGYPAAGTSSIALDLIEHLPIMLGSPLRHNAKEKHFFNNDNQYYEGSPSCWTSAISRIPLLSSLEKTTGASAPSRELHPHAVNTRWKATGGISDHHTSFDPHILC